MTVAWKSSFQKLKLSLRTGSSLKNKNKMGWTGTVSSFPPHHLPRKVMGKPSGGSTKPKGQSPPPPAVSDLTLNPLASGCREDGD